jgi:hypothetical protein
MELTNLDNLKEELESLRLHHDGTYIPPESVLALYKTIQTFNITLTDWNNLVRNIEVLNSTMHKIYNVLSALYVSINTEETSEGE